MKSTMKKIAASLLALLMMIQMVPALAATYSSGMIVGSAQGFREQLAVVASKGTCVLLGQTLELDVNEDYLPTWESEDEDIAAVDEKGILTAVAEGTVTIIARSGYQKATVEITVIDPEPILVQAAAEEALAQETAVKEPTVEETPAEVTPAEVIPTEETPEEETPVEEKPAEGTPEEVPAEEIPAEETPVDELPEEQPEENPEEQPEEEAPAEEEQKPEEQTEVAPVQKRALVIVINGENERTAYNGEEHVLDRFVATSNDDSFDASKIKVTGELGVKATDCGIYELKLEDVVFTYEDPNATAHFVVNNSFLRITPAPVTVTANEASKTEGEPDPELTATVVGLFGDDEIEYTLTRTPGEKVGEYVIEATGEELQGNYRINYVPAKFEIEGEPVVVIEDSIQPGQIVYFGTERILKAVVAGFGDVELTYQWQCSLDGEHWNDIEDATKKSYTYIIDEENAYYVYRVQVTPAE